MSTHFYVPRADASPAVTAWEPDAQPLMHATGIGHAIIELFARCRDEGLDVSIGPRIPRDATTVVVLLGSLMRNRPIAIARFYAQFLLGHRVRLILIRADESLAARSLIEPDVEVVNAPAAAKDRSLYIPLLPQRGLLTRAPERRGHLKSVGIKAYRHNLHRSITDGTLQRHLLLSGVTFRADSEALTDADRGFHDFTDLDAVICMQPQGLDDVVGRKPPTKLVNAWAAGTVPIVVDSPTYQALAVHGVNAYVVQSVDDIPNAVNALLHDRELLDRIEAGVSGQQRLFSCEAILRQWLDLLVPRTPPPRPPRRTLAAATALGRESIRAPRRLLASQRKKHGSPRPSAR